MRARIVQLTGALLQTAASLRNGPFKYEFNFQTVQMGLWKCCAYYIPFSLLRGDTANEKTKRGKRENSPTGRFANRRKHEHTAHRRRRSYSFKKNEKQR